MIWLAAIALAAVLGVAGVVTGIVFVTRGKKRGWIFVAGGVLAMVLVPIVYAVYVLVILVCTGRNGAWIC